ncbi:hypothetical protein SCLCIDRAFT_20322 [Scleroderma citrinum Foug A]|uniref:Uncharacterized protein n=1 Tax=Scleroderma citrinum Foug A TaxID=1036808 RepID=A0A0C3A416_9AGAM|nr:hypothetical protein SCLCIDRAFT_20322 [Scleroderma citrinum Foug A]
MALLPLIVAMPNTPGVSMRQLGALIGGQMVLSPLEARELSTFKESPRRPMNDTPLVAEELVILTEYHQSFTADILFRSSFLLTGVNDRMPRYPASKTLTSLPRKRIPESIGSLMGLILFLLRSFIAIRRLTLELTSLVKIPAFSPMKILLLQPFQRSGLTPPQKAVPTLRDWNNWLEINFQYIWKNGSRREQISVPTMLESQGNLFEETRDQWCANATLCHLGMADYVEGEFFPYNTAIVWPGCRVQCDDIVRINKSHTAGIEAADVETLYDSSGSEH